jgi:hypothetical protein
MSGIGLATNGVTPPETPPPPPAPIDGEMSWAGTSPFDVTGASGETSAAFLPSWGGGTPPYSAGWDIISNPSGKLSLHLFALVPHVDYQDMQINEQQSLTVRFWVNDAAHQSLSRTASVIIRRVS